MSATRVLLSLAAIVLGISALFLAHDVRAWQGAMRAGDAHFASHPGTAEWDARVWLPGGSAARILALGDDRSLRRAERAFAIAAAAPRGYDNGLRQSQLRIDAELALSEVAASGSSQQAARAGNLLGILAATNFRGTTVENENLASDTFDAAIRADPMSVDPKFNLELLLRRIRVVGTRNGAGDGGSGDLGVSLAGAGSGSPGSGY